MTLTSVIVVTYNSAHVVAKCLSPLAADSKVEIIVVDNASTDTSIATVREVAPTARIICNTSNTGFAAAVNRGVQEARGDYILLLNPDAQMSAAALCGLRNVMDSNSRLGAVAPIVSATNHRDRVIAAGMAPTVWRMFTHLTGLSRIPLSIFAGHYLLYKHVRNAKDLLSVDWLSGGCMLIRGAAGRAEGWLSERWFMYAEDIEFCLRLRDAGWTLAIDPTQYARHETGQSSAGIDGRISTVWLENLFDLYRRRYKAGWLRQRAWSYIVALGYSSRALVWSLRGTVTGRTDIYQSHRFGTYARAAVRLPLES